MTKYMLYLSTLKVSKVSLFDLIITLRFLCVSGKEINLTVHTPFTSIQRSDDRDKTGHKPQYL